MARPRVQGVAREHACKSCGADEWRRYNKKDGKQVYYCVPCNRRAQEARRSAPLQVLFDNARVRAKRRGLPFTISLADVGAAYPLDALCPISGEPFVFWQGKAHANSPTLEPRVPAYGFVPGNIVVLSLSEAARRRHELKKRPVIWVGVLP